MEIYCSSCGNRLKHNMVSKISPNSIQCLRCESIMDVSSEAYLHFFNNPKLIYKIRSHAGYDSYICTYWDAAKKEIIVREEADTGKVMGVFVREKV